MRATRTPAIAALVLALGAAASEAQVNFDTGQRVIDGVQLLQSATDAGVYYYVPKIPRLATRPDGTFELLCVKYVGGTRETNGGLFHALVEFTLPQDIVDAVEALKQQPKRWPVPLVQALDAERRASDPSRSSAIR